MARPGRTSLWMAVVGGVMLLMAAVSIFIRARSRSFLDEVKNLASDRPANERRQALWEIAQRADLRFIAAVEPLMTDPHVEVREVAAYYMGRVGGPKAAALLRERSSRDEAGVVRRTAILALGRIAGAVSDRELERIASDGDRYRRQAAWLALAHRGRADAVDRILSDAVSGVEPDEVTQFARLAARRMTRPLLEALGRSDLLLPEPDSADFVPAVAQARQWLRRHLHHRDLESNVRWITAAEEPLERVIRIRRARRTACRVLGLPRPAEWHDYSFRW